MLLPLRYFCLCATTLLSTSTLSFEPQDSLELTNKIKINWIIEDTHEWQDYLNGISKSTSQDTATIIMHGLEDIGYQLKFVKATGDRAEKILQDEQSACMSSRIKNTRREKFSTFSLPHELYLGLQLYRLAQSTPLSEQTLNEQGDVISLPHIFQHYPDHILAIASAVSYGDMIDKQIRQLRNSNVFIRAGNSRIASLLNMLLKKRIDYIIYYPQDIKNVNQARVSLENYTIAGSPSYFLGHVACSKTATGKKIINHINEILKGSYLTTEFYTAHEKWLIKGDLSKLRRYYLEVFNFLPDTSISN
jgi:uncharacterized protein (TIGR02285 family)